MHSFLPAVIAVKVFSPLLRTADDYETRNDYFTSVVATHGRSRNEMKTWKASKYVQEGLREPAPLLERTLRRDRGTPQPLVQGLNGRC